jgi:hypothetical protein
MFHSATPWHFTRFAEDSRAIQADNYSARDARPTFGLAAGASRPSDWPDYHREMVRWLDEHLKPTTPGR